MSETPNIVGKRFNVFKPCDDFPRDFVVEKVSPSGSTLFVRNVVEGYTVSSISFGARLNKNFLEVQP